MKQLLLLIIILVTGQAMAQHVDTAHIQPMPDSLSLLQAFKKGKTSGHFRYFMMTTQNTGDLSDYYANALGGGLKYQTAPFRGLQFGVSGFFIYNVGSSDLAEKDPMTQQSNRYEISLFDLEDPHNKRDMDRLEELYLKYANQHISIIFGKQLINTPFINPQDSRMRPTEVEGVYGSLKLPKEINLEAGWLYNISPRSTVEWYTVSQSIGINSQGVTIDGTNGDYKDHLQSKGIGLLGATFKPVNGLQFKIFNQYSDNLFNTAFLQSDYRKPIGKGTGKASFQYIQQDAIKQGGNADPAKTYFDPSNKVHIFGAQLGWEKPHWETTLNYTRITKDGRFTMPREWGTEPLFTYLSRERNEGYGDVNAIMTKIKGKLPKTAVRLELGYGHYYLPAIDNARLNKYKMPSYRHIKALAEYKFNGSLDGVDLALLWIYKGQLGKNVDDPKFKINKVDMSSFNVILNYSF